MKALAGNSVSVIQGSSIIALIVSFVFGAAVRVLIKMIGVIQVVMHIPLMNINVPPNAMIFYKTIIPIVNYDILSSFDFYEEFLTKNSQVKLLL